MHALANVVVRFADEIECNAGREEGAEGLARTPGGVDCEGAFGEAGVAVTSQEPHRTSFAVDLDLIQVERVVATALERFAVKDLAIENPPLDDVIRDIYRRGEAFAS